MSENDDEGYDILMLLSPVNQSSKLTDELEARIVEYVVSDMECSQTVLEMIAHNENVTPKILHLLTGNSRWYVREINV